MHLSFDFPKLSPRPGKRLGTVNWHVPHRELLPWKRLLLEQVLHWLHHPLVDTSLTKTGAPDPSCFLVSSQTAFVQELTTGEPLPATC